MKTTSGRVQNLITVAIKSIRRSQVTGLPNLMKGHRGSQVTKASDESIFWSTKMASKSPQIAKNCPQHIFGHKNGLYIYTKTKNNYPYILLVFDEIFWLVTAQLRST